MSQQRAALIGMAVIVALIVLFAVWTALRPVMVGIS
jgi:hypothetical protein